MEMMSTVFSWRFHKFKGKHIGYSLAEYGDCAIVSHAGGVFHTFLTNITWNIDGATEFECDITSSADNAADYDDSNGTIEKTEEETHEVDKPTNFNASVQFNGEVKVYGDDPHIDFHYANSESDYTSQIIETASGKLNIAAPNGVTVNGKKVDPTAVTLSIPQSQAGDPRLTDLACTAKYSELLGAVFVRIYAKIAKELVIGYDYDVLNIGANLPNSNAALAVKCGKNISAVAKTNGVIAIRPLESGIKGYDIYITGFWFV